MRSIGLSELAVLFAIFLIPAALAWVVAARRGGNGALWFAIGFVSGPMSIVVLILAFALNHHKPCPACRMRVHKDAILCPYCRTSLATAGA